jgi:hypothetical protein
VSVDAAVNGDWRSKRVSSNDNYFNPRARMIPSEHLSRQRAGMNGIFDLSLVKNISLGKRFEFFEHEIMKLALIAIGLLATTGVVYAACVFC